MEDVLTTYEKSQNDLEPVVCLDEKSMQLLANVKPTSRLVHKNRARRRDAEYSRRGVVNAFCVIEPKCGRHFIEIHKHRKFRQFAEVMRSISNEYPKALKIHAVMDNLSTHSRKALVMSFGPDEGTRIWDRFEVHFTPKHGSWLNQAEIEISMFSRQCLGKDRIASIATMRKRAGAWVDRMNREKVKINWTFTREKAQKIFRYESSKSPEKGH